jgi:hypothetical protein
MTLEEMGQRAVMDKLAIRPNTTVGIDDAAWPLPGDLRQQIAARARLVLAPAEEPLDVVLATVNPTTDIVALLWRWRGCLKPEGGIWLLTWKRGQQDYVDQRLLIASGLDALLVDNKVCSVSATVSAMRFVIRRADRP